MGVFGSIKGFFVTSEADVLKFIRAVWDEAPVAEKEIVAIAGWIIRVGIPKLTVDVAAITPIVAMLGTSSGHPELAASMVALNASMTIINKFAASADAGTLTADDVVQGYGALKTAGAAASSVMAKAATIVAITPASNAPVTKA